MSDAPQHVDFNIQLAAALSASRHKLLFQAAAIAASQQSNIFLVGGPVRDLILRRPLTDLDLVVEGDAWTVAEAFCAATNGRITRHAAFRTAVVEAGAAEERYSIDFVTARREEYPAPAALPVVSPSSMRDDLARRDFTINALALQLWPETTGNVLDPFGGRRDIEARVVRVLHAQSFFDDPTRVLRAVRFASRLAFTIDPATRDQIDRAIAETMIARTSPQRVLNELWLTLDEPRPEVVLQMLHDFGAFDQLALVWSEPWLKQFSAARTINFYDVALSDVYFGLMVWPMDQQQRHKFRSRYNVPTAQRKLLDELPGTLPAALMQPTVNDFELERALQAFSLVALRTLQLIAPFVAAERIEHYLTGVRTQPALLSGDDLRAHGVAPGPQYRLILAELRQAQLLQSITTHEAAVRWLTQRENRKQQ